MSIFLVLEKLIVVFVLGDDTGLQSCLYIFQIAGAKRDVAFYREE
jgi:hypothetical protein